MVILCRKLDAAINDSGTNGITGKSGRIVDIKFLHQMLAMLFDGLRADAKFRRSLFVGFAFGDQLQHFPLARRQFGIFFLSFQCGQSMAD